MNKYIISLFAVSLLVASCKDDDNDESGRASHSATYEANSFVFNTMGAYYYWNKEMFEDDEYEKPKIDWRTQEDTKAYFEALLSDKDRFSIISNNAKETQDDLAGISTSIGWDYLLTYLDYDARLVCAVVNLIYPNTPAERAGIQRGDVIYMVNGVAINENNYSQMMNTKNGTFTISRYNASKGEYYDFDVPITAEEITEDPVYHYSIMDGNIGYLMYTSFISNYNDELDEVFGYFKQNNVQKLILDLRYNPGGEMSAFQHLCSLIAPQNVVQNSSELLYYAYNELLTSVEGFSREESREVFDNKVTNNLNLKDIVIITGRNTYSASEATIMALKPYMNVTLIGDVTGGKNYTMFVLTPDLFEDVDSRGKHIPLYSEEINNWLIMPIVSEYFNTADETFDPNIGIIPDYKINEYDYEDMGTIGNENELLMAAAIEFIRTGAVSIKKVAKINERGKENLGHYGLGIDGAIMNR